jgi:hypothetical protein
LILVRLIEKLSHGLVREQSRELLIPQLIVTNTFKNNMQLIFNTAGLFADSAASQISVNIVIHINGQVPTPKSEPHEVHMLVRSNTTAADMSAVCLAPLFTQFVIKPPNIFAPHCTS